MISAPQNGLMVLLGDQELENPLSGQNVAGFAERLADTMRRSGGSGALSLPKRLPVVV